MKPRGRKPQDQIRETDDSRMPPSLSPASRARHVFCLRFLGLAPQALYCRPLRGLSLLDLFRHIDNQLRSELLQMMIRVFVRDHTPFAPA
jgi:hypothetical protein